MWKQGCKRHACLRRLWPWNGTHSDIAGHVHTCTPGSTTLPENVEIFIFFHWVFLRQRVIQLVSDPARGQSSFGVTTVTRPVSVCLSCWVKARALRLRGETQMSVCLCGSWSPAIRPEALCSVTSLILWIYSDNTRRNSSYHSCMSLLCKGNANYSLKNGLRMLIFPYHPGDFPHSVTYILP